MVTDEAEVQRLAHEAHRAIGRYVVTFSRLIYQMRLILSQALTTDDKLGDLAFWERRRSKSPIASSESVDTEAR